jgi:hypothetical protein
MNIANPASPTTSPIGSMIWSRSAQADDHENESDDDGRRCSKTLECSPPRDDL